jgi:hypothetical protein
MTGSTVSLRQQTMKRVSLLLLSAIALFTNACEKHSASELTKIEESEPRHEGENGAAESQRKSENPAEQGKASESASPAAKFFSH